MALTKVSQHSLGNSAVTTAKLNLTTLSAGNTVISGTANISGAVVMSNTVTLSSNGGLTLPVGNTAQRPSTADGLIRFNSQLGLEANHGNGWVTVVGRDGSNSALAAASAVDILKAKPRAPSGYYWLITPSDGVARQWWCDMATDGGGWILVARQATSTLTNRNSHWFNTGDAGGFNTVSSGTYMGGGYWSSFGAREVMWDVQLYSTTSSNHKVAFNWGGEAFPSSAGSNNIPNKTFGNFSREVYNAGGFNPSNFSVGVQNNTVRGNANFTENFYITFSFRDTGGSGDAGSDLGPYWGIGNHYGSLHQHYEETLAGSAVYGAGKYEIQWNEDTSWGGGGNNSGYTRYAAIQSTGHVNIWIR